MNDVLVAGLWQGALVTGIAAAAAFAVPQRHAATRYSIWFCALAALAIVPLIALWHPSPRFDALPLPAARTAVVVTAGVTTRAANAGGSILLAVWLAGVAVAAARLAFSYVRIRRIVRGAAAAPELGPEVMVSSEIAMPIAAGFTRGIVLIPAHITQTLDAEDLRSVIRHERAHVARRDVAGNFIQRCIEALLFFNPWAYVIGRALVKEREEACDDWVVHFGGAPDRYASCLTHLARNARSPRTPLLTPSAIGSRRMLLRRITRLLNGKATQLKTNYFAVGACAAAFALLALALQSANGIASAAPAGAQIAANAPKLPPACYHDVKIVSAAAPDIKKADYRPNASANALVTVAANGDVLAVRIVKSSGSAAIDRATIEAARRSTYAPEMTKCKAETGQYLFKVQTGPG